eukprot:sb/3475543/
MAQSRDYISPGEMDCLTLIDGERNTTSQELESIQHILWMNFQDSARFTAALCKGGAAGNPLLQSTFQQCAIAVTRLYKDSVDAVERAYELGMVRGKQKCRRDMASWSKRRKRKINRIDLLRKVWN